LWNWIFTHERYH